MRDDKGVVGCERRPGRSLGRGRGVGRDVEPLPRGPAEVLGARGVVDDRVVRGHGADQRGGEKVGTHWVRIPVSSVQEKRRTYRR